MDVRQCPTCGVRSLFRKDGKPDWECVHCLETYDEEDLVDEMDDCVDLFDGGCYE